MSIGRAPIEPGTRQYIQRVIEVGPFDAADASGGYSFILVGTGNTPLPITTGPNADTSPEFLDGVSLRCITKTSQDGCTLRLAYKTTGQTMAAAVTAEQYLTDAYDLNDMTNEVPVELTVNTSGGMPYNRIPADSQLFFVTGAACTALVGLVARIVISGYPG